MPNKTNSSTSAAEIAQAAADPHADLPPLAKDRAFFAMTATQFLGAFNDNLFKQLVLLLSVAGVVGAANGGGQGADRGDDLQSIAMFIFAVPFLLFSGFAGFLSDRYSKRRVIVLAKVGEIVIMLLGVAAFAARDVVGLPGLFGVLFLMGSQSAFFGPGKYGILPEMLHARDLPAANGVIQMTTFVAIILGMALAGLLKESLSGHLWAASAVCVGIAVVGTLTSLGVRKVPIASPGLKFTPEALFVPGDMLRLLKRDGALRAALLASCMFWFVAGIVQPSVNALGIKQLDVGDGRTSLLAACIALGIAVGCMSAGLWSRHKVSGIIVQVGAWGVVATLGLLGLPAILGPMLFNFPITALLLGLAGFFAGMFAVPIQVFLQSRPPQDQKGRMIATMNWANWLAIVASAVVYGIFDLVLNQLEWAQSTKFAFTAALMLPIAILYRPAEHTLRDAATPPAIAS